MPFIEVQTVCKRKHYSGEHKGEMVPQLPGQLLGIQWLDISKGLKQLNSGLFTLF